MRTLLIVICEMLMVSATTTALANEHEVARCAAVTPNSENILLSDVRVLKDVNGAYSIRVLQSDIKNKRSEIVVLENAGLLEPHVVRAADPDDIEKGEIREDSFTYGEARRGLELSIGYAFQPLLAKSLFEQDVRQAYIKGKEVNNGQFEVIPCQFRDNNSLPQLTEETGYRNMLNDHLKRAKVLK
jgi:hypothetical protein